MSDLYKNPYIEIYHPSEFELESQRNRCSQAGSDPGMKSIPRAVGKELHTSSIQRHAIHMYTSKLKNFYKSFFDLISYFNVAYFLVDCDFTVYNCGGEKGLLSELSNIGLAIGCDLSEQVSGYNAVNLFRSLFGKNYIPDTCIMLDAGESYLDALKPYVFLAFEATSYIAAYGVQYHLLVVRKEDFNRSAFTVIGFMRNFNEGLIAKAYNLPPLEFAESIRDLDGTMQVFTDRDGYITLVSEPFCKLMDTDTTKIGGHLISDVIPCTRAALHSVKSGRNLYMRNVRLKDMTGKCESYYMDAVGIKSSTNQVSDILFTFRDVKSEKYRAGRLVSEGAYFSFDDIVGCNNAEFKRAKTYAQKIAAGDSNVLISGESGTGKELFAQAIHQASSRCNQPFVSINCAAIPKELISSELFGYDEGAFTGAKKNGHPGKFEIADGGTLFLDEIGEMPLDMQSVLLRVIEEQRITRLGSANSRRINVRIIAASNRNLLECIKNKTFRADLYYRINVMQLDLMPLRRRKEDIPMLANYFLRQLSANSEKAITEISKEAMNMLVAYDWPGNIRELRNIIERAVNVCTGQIIYPMDISLNGNYLAAQAKTSADTPLTIDGVNKEYNDYEVQRIKELLKKHNNNKTAVAKELGISRRTLYNKLSKSSESKNGQA